MSHGALHGLSQRGMQLSFALLALLLAALATSVGSPSVSEAPSLPGTAPSSKSPHAGVSGEAARGYEKLPLAFVPNRGQTDKSVRYYAEGTGHSFYFTPEGAVLSFTKKSKGVALDLKPLGASPSMRLVASERARGKVNYLVGSERHRNLPTYRELSYRNVWPGIDLVFRGQGGALKYELRAQAGADLSNVALAYGGADGLSVGKGGSLLVQTPLGTLRDARPRSYQRVGGKRVPVESRYAVKSRGNAYGFALGSYDRGRPLVIDPGIEYSTFVGGTSDDLAYGLAVDGAGNAYITGRTASSGFPATTGAFDTTFNGGGDNIYTSFGDAFVAKLNATGTALEYASYLGGSTAGDVGLGIAVVGSNAYVTGSTGSTNFPTTAGAYDTTYNGASNGGTNAFVTKLSADGSSLEYSTYLAGSVTQGFGDLGTAIAVDSTGSAYVTGDAHSSNFPTTPGAYDTTYNGGEDVFITKLNPSGSALPYSTYVGGTNFDSATALAIDGSGNAYIAGYGTSTDYPTTAGAYDTSYNTNWDAFITKINASGSALSYSTYLGGTAYDEARGIAVDAAGSAYVSDFSNANQGSAPFPTTAGAYDTTYNGGYDIFVTKFSPTGGGLSYSTLLGGTNDGYDEYGRGIAVDANGSAYVTGYTKATNFPAVRATDSTYNGGAYDAVVAKLSANGQALDFSTYLGGSSEDRGTDIAVNAETGRIYVAGQTASSGFPTTAGAFDTSRNGGFDSFVTKFAPIGSTLTRREDPAVVQEALPDSTGYAAVGNVNVQMPSRLLGIDPGNLVAFRVGDNGWEQIPVQVDEREVMDINRVYTTSRPTCSDPCYSNPPNGGAIHPEYTDPNTFVGPDSNPTLDSDDEVALMAADAGGPRTTHLAPAGVDTDSAVEVKITDPLDGGVGYAYLFEDTSGLDPAAGQDYVAYQFNLTNGPYKTGAYKPNGVGAGNGMNFGPRPETSSVTTDNYQRGFTDRWYDNELRVTKGSATGVDILDRHDDQFDAADVSCVRTQDTFRRGEGAFIVNKDGPVRALRDFIGANSGPHVQRQHVFYDDLEVINTFLRVHPIPGVVDFFDYSAAGQGLIYENGVDTPGGFVSGTPAGGVAIDGQPDAVTGVGTSGLPGVETVDGPQGGLSMPQRLLTNNPDPGYHLDYRDGNPLQQPLCTGDDNQLYGASGPQLNSAVNNTDEAGRNMWGGGQYSNLFYQRSVYYEAPGQANGQQRLAEMKQPLELSLQGVDLEPSGGTIVIQKDAVPDNAQDFSFTALGLTPTSFTLDDDSDGTLSNTQTFTNVPPGNGYSVSESSVAGWSLTSATCDDGSPVTNIDVSAGETVTCTFVNNAASERPIGASPIRVPLVPAFDGCTSANSAHGQPLNFDSCNPPSPASSTTRFGTKSTGFAQVMVCEVGAVSPACGQSGLVEPDVRLFANLRDVRCAGSSPAGCSAGGDYNPNGSGPYTSVCTTAASCNDGSGLAQPYCAESQTSSSDCIAGADLTEIFQFSGAGEGDGLRITDTNNGPNANVPATVSDTGFAVPIDCLPTPSNATIGSTCVVNTSANALVPGVIQDGMKAVWRLGQIRVLDSGPDGSRGNSDDEALAAQGIYLP